MVAARGQRKCREREQGRESEERGLIKGYHVKVIIKAKSPGILLNIGRALITRGCEFQKARMNELFSKFDCKDMVNI
jgi:hypothetical protein